ncbi:hypothetical protein [Pedobacter africanus]|uniref:Uncharacterized protein n=1 Tax=Pedobacter africanus TaxID=151894 RepID=A0A1W2B385_9SPHI|nr:hypothetical protein [Pedobacter africanus]SMC66858.1 hypothetical protein SAMN04488524_1824 [Pedobacter africanus]
MKKNHFKKFLTLFFILTVGSSVFYACKKNTEVENNEPLSLNNYKSTHLKKGVTEADVQSTLKKSALLYGNKALEDILSDLVSKNKITEKGKASILASVQGKTQDQFVKGALQRISSLKHGLPLQIKKFSYSNSNPLSNTIQPGPFEELNDAGFSAFEQQMMFDYIILELTNQGISWSCAIAIAGVGLTIAALFVGGPATVAAAALWGASHVVAVISLKDCAPQHKNYVEDIKNQFATEQDFIDYFQNNVSNNGPLEWTEIPGNFLDGFQTDVFLNDVMINNGLTRILVQPYNESIPSLMDANDGNWYFFNGTTGVLVLGRSGLLVAHNFADLTSYTIRYMWITGSPLQEMVLVVRLRN